MKSTTHLLKRIANLLAPTNESRWAEVCEDLLDCYKIDPKAASQKVTELCAWPSEFNDAYVDVSLPDSSNVNTSLVRLRSMLSIECRKPAQECLEMAA